MLFDTVRHWYNVDTDQPSTRTWLTAPNIYQNLLNNYAKYVLTIKVPQKVQQTTFKLLSCHYFFVLKMFSAYYVYCIYSSTFQTRFIHGSKQYEL